ncbi:unnamed protein product [Colias eurytheme]|nr:unnamed protein product [Colias eurytheme]
MSGRGAGGQRCQLILQRCLAIHLTKPGNAPDDFWMYDSGYLLFQSFLAANAKCWWAGALAAATAELRYAGYVSPGVLLVAGAPRALETVRGAYSRSVLKPPPTYLICGLDNFLTSIYNVTESKIRTTCIPVSTNARRPCKDVTTCVVVGIARPVRQCTYC